MLKNEFSEKIKRDPQIAASINEMMNGTDFNTFITSLRKKKTTYLIVALVIEVLICGALIAIFFANDFPLGAAFIGILFVIAFIASFYLIGKTQNQHLTNELAPRIVKALYGNDAEYDLHGGFSEAYLTDIDLFPVNELEQEDMIKGEYHGVACKVADVTSYHWEYRSNGKNTTREKVIDYHGLVMSLKMNKRSASRLVAAEGGKLFGGKHLEFESIDFNKKFKVYGEEQNGFYIITPVMQIGMIDIVDSVPGRYTFLFRDEELVIAAGGFETKFKTDIKKPLNHNVNLVLDAILPMAYFIKTLRLDLKYYNKEAPQQQTSTQPQTDADDVIAGLTGAGVSVAGPGEDIIHEVVDGDDKK